MLDRPTLKRCSGAHQFKWVKSDYICHEKGNRERYWFSGLYGICTQEGCDAQGFVGDRRAYYRDTVGEEGPDQILSKEKTLTHV